MLDRNNPLPLYYQLAERLKRQIELSEIKPGDKLPSESEMVELHGVGRLTIRQGLSQLVTAGYLQKAHGKGTFCIKSQARDKNANIDVILDMTNAYFTPYLMKGISQVLMSSNFNFIVHDSKDDSIMINDLLAEIIRKGSSGLIPIWCGAKAAPRRQRTNRSPCFT